MGFALSYLGLTLATGFSPNVMNCADGISFLRKLCLSFQRPPSGRCLFSNFGKKPLYQIAFLCQMELCQVTVKSFIQRTLLL